jgi:putative hydrolase of the HAD superfamily
LWDYESNSEETLKDLFVRFHVLEKGVTSFRYFFETFRRVNFALWDRYDRGLIGQEVIRTERFHQVFQETGVDDLRFSLEFSKHYLRELPLKKNLLPQAKEVLDYLHPRYPLTVVTNGFDEIQYTKMTSAGIEHYFAHVVTSQRAGNKKPSPQIFEFALRQSGHDAANTVMIGDNLQTDIAGARAAGIDSIYFNPQKETHQQTVNFEIHSLKELMSIL